MFLTLVSANKDNFTKRELVDAKLARNLHHKLGNPWYTEYFRLLEKKHTRNCPITIDDTKRAPHIYSPEAKLKLNIIQQNPLSINELTYIPKTNTILYFHPNVKLFTD